MNKERTIKERTVKVEFKNLEFKGADLSFDYEGVHYDLVDSENYNLPVSVVNHLNSLHVKEPQSEEGPNGERAVKVIKRNRFSCIPVEL